MKYFKETIQHKFKDGKDDGDSVLTPFLIGIPLLVGMWVMGMSISDQAVNAATQRSLAQNAVNRGASQIKGDGFIHKNKAINATIRAYENSDQTRTVGQASAEGVCDTIDLKGTVGLDGQMRKDSKVVSAPYYEFQLVSSGVSGNLSDRINDNGLVEGRGSYKGYGGTTASGIVPLSHGAAELPENEASSGSYDILRVKIYDASQSMFHLEPWVSTCNVQEAEVSAAISMSTDAYSESSESPSP